MCLQIPPLAVEIEDNLAIINGLQALAAHAGIIFSEVPALLV
jgi:hypothetical protein